MNSSSPPVGQVVDGWRIVGRVDGTRSWNLTCIACGHARTASGIVVGKALTGVTALAPCTECDQRRYEIDVEDAVDILRYADSELFDLDAVADLEPDRDLVDRLAQIREMADAHIEHSSGCAGAMRYIIERCS